MTTSKELGKPYVPLKIIGAALDYKIAWDPTIKSVTFAKEGNA
ncbi:stalk domain-containing protein [Paenibacillus crassostreae]|nr:stalk domain-containing protein [Paenibacillus crassostreae]